MLDSDSGGLKNPAPTARISLPRLIELGGNSLSKLPEVLSSVNCQRPFLICDALMAEIGVQAKVQDACASAGIPLTQLDIFSEVMPEPTEDSLLLAISAMAAGEYDGVIALGGGSAIDSAKAIAFLAAKGGRMSDYKVPTICDQAGLPLVAIPTTAGTGSEATQFTIITDAQSDEKMLCKGLAFLPQAAIVDYTLSMTVPPRVTADTGIDALTHAIEAYVSRRANAFSDQQALAAMALIAPNLRKVFHHGDDEYAREQMMLGSHLAGVAFSNASVALVHGMSRPIGAHFHVPHGLSNAMLLPAVTRYSIPAAVERYADCARAMKIVSANEKNDQEACAVLLDYLEDLNKDLQVPSPEDFGINRDSFMQKRKIMAEQALASGSPGNNPRVPSLEEMQAIYTELWN
ncbi:iron-containing alcohol dehydrogenase [Pseudoteredinibacter isoporae]|uniref:Alcohol dehydrogenase n=1 Tax=Pseudoteredinibacter isoporae TaxID=570281 RepID=A0A7X0MV09_9GAMM|nr:iron-containing alcohol dehydrogenase [Pseudoteredinibacter isoporae]MBB6520878.1 alcohol dehydrogenase [Pseudoteredinibacter isoporae]NHO86443.1 iron-containing alcohol dehydrogenase [Pseudoteredinibacter isoporae]NIB25105.1 iron-containing alcohol dehydrogenase [Pseudoteredinibacter isoporae]